ncbi:hypothetical protein [Acidiphilium sp. 37-64-53]|uniref:hypothetical protein n=1 Tax=Acidiphilium sp. 37-64-53 TaxID=1970299 RepID=UPI00257D0B49|nr:hypothetical protein [Acidiphilium sp. 37-64-53]
MDGSSGAVDGVGEGGSPHLTLDGFDGSLALLLAQARAHQIDLSTLRLPELIDQLADRLERARATIPLGHQADWVVMASWILLLRSDLLLPRDAPAQAPGWSSGRSWDGTFLPVADLRRSEA